MKNVMEMPAPESQEEVIEKEIIDLISENPDTYNKKNYKLNPAFLTRIQINLPQSAPKKIAEVIFDMRRRGIIVCEIDDKLKIYLNDKNDIEQGGDGEYLKISKTLLNGAKYHELRNKQPE
jgi:hypothetical protein